MRYILPVLLLPAWASVALAQDNEAETLFRDIEKRMKAANAVQIKVDIELRAVKGKEEESRFKNNVSKGKGELLATKDNRVRMKISAADPEDFPGMELASNGKQLKLAIPGGEVPSIDRAKAMPTPSHLHGLVSTVVSRAGVTAGSEIITFAPGPQFTPVFLAAGEDAKKEFDPDSFKLSAWGFTGGAGEKFAGRDAKVIHYKLGTKDDRDSAPMTLWIDAKTLLPFKRVAVLSGQNLHITEVYSVFDVAPKIEPKAFELLPAPGNDAEKLFHAMEEKIKAANVVEVAFDIEMKGNDEEGTLKGSLLFTKDHKARLKIVGNQRGENRTMEMVSDGKRMKAATSPDTLANVKAEPTLANLHARLSIMVSRPGAWGYIDFILLMGPVEIDATSLFSVADFKAGAPEKVGGRDAKVITYRATIKTQDAGRYTVTVWIDAETLLPVKRLIVPEGLPARISETCRFALNPEVDAKAFVLVK